MNRALKFGVLAVAFAMGLAAAGPALADCAPAKLVRMVTSLVPIGVPPDFAKKPKVLYRLGNGKTRIEEQPDPEQGVHLLLITDAPMAWHIDLATKTGTAARDPDVPSLVRAPVFSEPELPKEIQQLEFGCEREFIASPDTIHAPMESTKVAATKHSVVSGKWKATLIVVDGRDVPDTAMLSENGKVVTAVRYRSYETLEQVPEGLFAPPPGL